MEKTATFNKKFKWLTYWNSKNTTVTVNCENIKTARLIIKNLTINQSVIIS